MAHGGESDDDDGAPRNAQSDTDSETPAEQRSRATSTNHPDGQLQDGMLARDLPKRTAFYNSVAERQMSQTDAKLFYLRSQIDLQKISTGSRPSQTPPLGSPVLAVKDDHEPPSSHHVADSPLPGGRAAHRLEQRNRNVSSGSASGQELQLPPPSLPSSGRPELIGGIFSTLSQDPQLLSGMGAVNQKASGAFAPPNPRSEGAPNATEPVLGPGAFLDTGPHITAELSDISRTIDNILQTRRKYLQLSLQRDGDNPKDAPTWPIYPPPPEPAWASRVRPATAPDGQSSMPNSLSNSMLLPQEAPTSPASHKKHNRKRKPGQNIGDDFDMDELLPLPGPSKMTFKLDDSGVYQVFDGEHKASVLRVPTIREFYMDLDEILTISSDGPSKSFAFRRLQYLEGKFSLYVLLNEYQETADSKSVPHRDFYNVRKVDTHVHHSACMNQKHLLRFIKSKMKKCPDEVVLFRDGKHLTLAEVFDSINLTAYDLSIDTLDMHVSLQAAPPPSAQSPRRKVGSMLLTV